MKDLWTILRYYTIRTLGTRALCRRPAEPTAPLLTEDEIQREIHGDHTWTYAKPTATLKDP